MTVVDITNAAAARGAQLVRANGIDIAYRDLGDGPPVVLLHGALASTGPAWAGSPVAHLDHLATLAEHFRVIAPDTRGSGATVHPGGPADTQVLADDVAGLIDALALDRPCVAGFSEGGTTATVLALRHPGAVRALVNHSGFDAFDPEAAAYQTIRPIFGGRPDATSADPDAAVRAAQDIPGLGDVLATMRADYDGAQGEGYWRTYLGQFFDRWSMPLDLSVEDLARISVPTLILTGDRDWFCPVEAACQAFRTIPEAELGIVPATGHEINAAVVDAMIGFLARHTAD